jgi:HK97 family phage portal protein
MGWLDGGRKAIGLQVPDGDHNTIVIPSFAGGKPNQDGALYPDASYASSAQTGYGRNELVYACIRERSENLPQSVLRVYPGQHGEALEEHRLRRLLAQPNPVTNEFEFFELSVTYLDLAGNCYWLIQRGRDGFPAELWPLRPDLIRVLPTRSPRVWNYGYVVDPSTSARGTLTEIIPVAQADIVHIKYPNPLDAYFGQPPLRAAARATSLDNAATDFVDNLLRNDATPKTVVITQDAVNEEIADRIRSKWFARHSGGRGGPAFLQKGMDVKPLGLNLRDLEFPDLRSISETRICMTFKVPPILVGAKVGLDRSTFSNYREARVSLWEESIMPLQRRFGDAIQTRLLPEFSGVGRSRVQMRWDNSDVLALREGEKDKWERATNALARGGVSINDFRRTVGLEPVGGGDVFLIPAGVVPSPIDGIAAVPDQAEVEAAPQRPQLEAAAYADRFLAELSRKQAVNGHALVG